MKQKIILFIITVALVASCLGIVSADNSYYEDNPGDIIPNPWAELFTEEAGTAGDITWEFGTTKKATNPSGKNTAVPAKAVIKKIYKKKYASKKIKMSVKKAKNAVGYQAVVFKTKKDAKKLMKPIFAKSFLKTKFTLKSKEFKNKKKLFVRVRAFSFAKTGSWSKIKKVKIKK